MIIIELNGHKKGTRANSVGIYANILFYTPVFLKLWYTYHLRYLGSSGGKCVNTPISFLRLNDIPLWRYAKTTQVTLMIKTQPFSTVPRS